MTAERVAEHEGSHDAAEVLNEWKLMSSLERKRIQKEDWPAWDWRYHQSADYYFRERVVAFALSVQHRNDLVPAAISRVIALLATGLDCVNLARQAVILPPEGPGLQRGRRSGFES